MCDMEVVVLVKTPETKALPPATAEVKSMPPVVPLDLTKLTIGSATIEFAAIQPGPFTMGGVYDENEKPGTSREHYTALPDRQD